MSYDLNMDEENDIGIECFQLKPEVNDKNLNLYCRICADIKDSMIPIFTNEGIAYDLGTKMNKHFPFTIAEEDALPKSVCVSCATTLIKWDEMHANCFAADQKLRNILEEQEKLIETRPNNSELGYCDVDIGLNDISNVELDTDPLRDDNYSDDNYNDDDKLSDDDVYDNESQQEDDPFDDNITAPEVTIHFSKTKRATTKNTTNKKLKTSPKKVAVRPKRSCNNKSDKVNKSKKTIKKEETIEEEEEAEVSLDKSSNSNADSIGNEDNEAASGNDAVVKDENTTNDCQQAWFSFNKLDDKQIERPNKKSIVNAKIEFYSKREQDILLERIFECDKCEYRFDKKFKLNNHYQVHLDNFDFICHICAKAFRRNTSLKMHIDRMHLKIKNHTCDICKRSFADRSTLYDHRRIHTGEKPYVCELCGKSFRTATLIWSHRHSHSNNYVFNCDICHKKFRYKQNLREHVKIHSNQKCYTCEMCGIDFQQSSSLKRHSYTHSNVKPFICSICSASFKMNRYLKHHMKTQHS